MITPREQSVVEQILASYGLDFRAIADPQKGYRNRSYAVSLPDGRVANLILYKTEPGILARIHNANRVSNFLASQGLPARQTLSPRIIQLHYPGKTRYGALYNYLPGTTIPWESYTMGHIKLLGATMAHLHTTLRHLPRERLPLVTDEYLVILRRMQTYFSDPEVSDALCQKLKIFLNYRHTSRLVHVLEAAKTLPSQPLHMDFVRSNLLFAETGSPVITGILDFEKTAYGHPLFDIARTLAFLLVDCKYKTETQVKKYFLHSGYQKRGEQPLHNFRLLTELTNLFLMYDFYKFLRHNPYEYLQHNEHYLRTRDALVSRNLLKSLEVMPMVTGEPRG